MEITLYPETSPFQDSSDESPIEPQVDIGSVRDDKPITINSLTPSSNPSFNVNALPIYRMKCIKIWFQSKLVLEKQDFSNFWFILHLDELLFSRKSLVFQMQTGYFIELDNNGSLGPVSVFPLSSTMKALIKSKIDDKCKLLIEIDVKKAETGSPGQNWRRKRLEHLEMEIGIKRKLFQQKSREFEHLKLEALHINHSMTKIHGKFKTLDRKDHAKLQKIQLELNQVQSKRILEVETIFPVQNNQIRSIHVPDSIFYKVDKDQIALGLSYTAHSILLIAWYFQIPLRYPITAQGNRTYITDNISKYSNLDEIPLNMNHFDKTKFEYGVYLLNKNIEQVCSFLGIRVMNLRKLLGNLQLIYDKIENEY